MGVLVAYFMHIVLVLVFGRGKCVVYNILYE